MPAFLPGRLIILGNVPRVTTIIVLADKRGTMLKIKRAYEQPEAEDGERVLVDRLWPRGLSKDKLKIDRWEKVLAPSDDLRKWFGHEAEKWDEFKRRYREELATPESSRILDELATASERGNITLVYGTKDTEHSNARVLQELIGERIPSAHRL